jgi:hypothetical protein
MRSSNLTLTIAITCAAMRSAPDCPAHIQPVHMRISDVAARHSSGLTSFLSEHIGTTFAPFDANPPLRFTGAGFTPVVNPPIEWMVQGSNHEDAKPRFLNHFYALRASPRRLTDLKAYQELLFQEGFDAGPTIHSFEWATKKGFAPSDANRVNGESWQNARDYQFDALTKNSRFDRDAKLAHMLFALGKIIHLNQDLSSPDHTRNDAHPGKVFGILVEKNWFEAYGITHFQQHPEWFPPPAPERRNRAYWRNAGFQKLEDFWNRHLYTGQSSTALNDEASGGTRLGLAEIANGNFLGEDSTYREYFTIGTPEYALHYFPFPSRNTGTTYNNVRAQIQAGDVAPADYADGLQRNSIYLRKIADGIPVTHHSIMPFFLAMTLNNHLVLDRIYAEYTPRINNANVLQEYHAILLPKAVEYSTGILEYFFRGRIEAWAAWDTGLQKYKLRILNQSGDTLKGPTGAFTLWRDDVGGNRSSVPLTLPFSGTLAHGAVIEGTFSAPPTGSEAHTLVFKGTVGVDVASAKDPVDENIAIAANKFTVSAFDCGTTAAAIYDAEWHNIDNVPFGGDIVQGSGSFALTMTEMGGTAASKETALCNPGPAYPVEIRVTWSVSGNIDTFFGGAEVGIGLIIDGGPAINDSRDFETGPFSEMVVQATIPANKVTLLQVQVSAQGLGDPSATFSGTLTITPLAPP